MSSLPPQLADAMAAQRKRQQQLMIVIGVLVTIVAGVIGAFAGGLLRFGATAPSVPTVRAQGTAPDPSLMKGGTPPPPVTNLAAEAPPQMPADVYAWLKHLEQCERRKVEISGDQSAEMMVFMQKSSVLGAGMGLMNPYDQSEGGAEDAPPADYTKGKILDLRPRWQELLDFYHSVPPPAECQPLASDFGQAMNEIPGVMGDLGGILNDLANNPEEALKQLNRMKNGSYGNIDRYFARADQKLGAICSKYRTPKWFNIVTDVGTGSMFGKSLGNMGGF